MGAEISSLDTVQPKGRQEQHINVIATTLNKTVITQLGLVGVIGYKVDYVYSYSRMSDRNK